MFTPPKLRFNVDVCENSIENNNFKKRKYLVKVFKCFPAPPYAAK